MDIQEVLGLLPVLSLVGLQAKVLLGKGLFSKVLKLFVCGPLLGPFSKIVQEIVSNDCKSNNSLLVLY